MRGQLECKSAFIGNWKKFWAVFANDLLNLYKAIPVRTA